MAPPLCGTNIFFSPSGLYTVLFYSTPIWIPIMGRFSINKSKRIPRWARRMTLCATFSGTREILYSRILYNKADLVKFDLIYGSL